MSATTAGSSPAKAARTPIAVATEEPKPSIEDVEMAVDSHAIKLLVATSKIRTSLNIVRHVILRPKIYTLL